MSQKFKLKYDELRENNPANQPDENAHSNSGAENKNQVYDRPGNIRNLCFAWPDGTKQFLNYAYLVSVKLNIGNEINTITQVFTSHTVTLKGYNLEPLFLELNGQFPSFLVQTDSRYSSGIEKEEYLISEITIEDNK